LEYVYFILYRDHEMILGTILPYHDLIMVRLERSEELTLLMILRLFLCANLTTLYGLKNGIA